LKTFVANRVVEIQNKTNTSEWRHVPTTDNPADLISRGQSPEDFLRPIVWPQGPSWLQHSEEHWPTWSLAPLLEIPEQKSAICLSATITDYTLLQKYSSWPKLIRITARCLRWKQKVNRASPLTRDDLNTAHNKLIRLIQQQHFAEEISALRKNRDTAVRGTLTRLNPFLDGLGRTIARWGPTQQIVNVFRTEASDNPAKGINHGSHY
jgi:hypothetical protein